MKAKLVQWALGAAGPVLLQILTAFVSNQAFDALVQIAVAEVQKLEGVNVDGDVKRKAAFVAIKQALVEQGLSVQTTLIYLAIELAVNQVRAAIASQSE